MSSDVMQGNERSWAETPPMNPPLRHAIGELVERQTWLDQLAKLPPPLNTRSLETRAILSSSGGPLTWKRNRAS